MLVLHVSQSLKKFQLDTNHFQKGMSNLRGVLCCSRHLSVLVVSFCLLNVFTSAGVVSWDACLQYAVAGESSVEKREEGGGGGSDSHSYFSFVQQH